MSDPQFNQPGAVLCRLIDRPSGERTHDYALYWMLTIGPNGPNEPVFLALENIPISIYDDPARVTEWVAAGLVAYFKATADEHASGCLAAWGLSGL